MHDVEWATRNACVVGVVPDMPGFAKMRRTLVPGRHIGAPGLLQTFLEETHDLVIFRMDANQRWWADLRGLFHSKINGSVIKAEPSSFLPSGPDGVRRWPLHHMEVVLEGGNAEVPRHPGNIESLLVRGNKSREENIDTRIAFHELDELRHDLRKWNYVLGPRLVDVFLAQFRTGLHHSPSGNAAGRRRLCFAGQTIF